MTIVNELLWANAIEALGAMPCVCRHGTFRGLVENDVAGADADGVIGHRSKITTTLKEIERYQLAPGDWIDADNVRYVVQYIAQDTQGVADIYVEALG